MRNLDRIKPFCDTLGLYWKEWLPDMRFGQFITNFISWLTTEKGVSDIWYIEDNRMMEYFAEFFDQCKPVLKENDDYGKGHYVYKSGVECPLTREEIYSKIDPFDLFTVLPWCERFDIPFIKEVWINYRNSCFNRKIDMKYVFGKYLSCMKLKGYKDYTFDDSILFYLKEG